MLSTFDCLLRVNVVLSPEAALGWISWCFNLA